MCLLVCKHQLQLKYTQETAKIKFLRNVAGYKFKDQIVNTLLETNYILVYSN
jgi:hypothetical protein